MKFPILAAFVAVFCFAGCESKPAAPEVAAPSMGSEAMMGGEMKGNEMKDGAMKDGMMQGDAKAPPKM